MFEQHVIDIDKLIFYTQAEKQWLHLTTILQPYSIWSLIKLMVENSHRCEMI